MTKGVFGFRVAGLLLLGLTTCAGQRGTIGAVLGQQTDGRVLVREVPADLAAGRAGLREGDELLLVGGKDVRALTSEELHQALSGDVGDTVKLTLVRGEDIVRVTLKLTPARRLRAAR